MVAYIPAPWIPWAWENGWDSDLINRQSLGKTTGFFKGESDILKKKHLPELKVTFLQIPGLVNIQTTMERSTIFNGYILTKFETYALVTPLVNIQLWKDPPCY